MSDEERIDVGQVSDEDGTDVTLPVVEVLTGRAFVTGKSGSGKSNTASVVIEELLDAGYPLLVVDTDGEYYGLKEEYEMLHAGADEECDIQVNPEHAERLATLALEENVPIILDVSGYLEEDVADELLRETARHLFAKEKKLKKPFLLVVEEVHEYLPQKGGGGAASKMLIKIGKRGRKHGLGVLGISQRPADVKKDFITQANWMVWHRLTWDNDTKVVGRVLGDEYEAAVPDLGDGEAFVQTDWTEADVRRVQFRRKRTFDAGATPGLEDVERPELKSVSSDLMDDLETISEEESRRESELADLQQELDKKNARIKQLEQDLEQAKDVSNAARQLANAFRRNDLSGSDEELQAALQDREDRIEELETERDELRTELETREGTIDAQADRIVELGGDLDDAYDRIDALEAETDRLQRELMEARQASLDQYAPAEGPDDRRVGDSVGDDGRDGQRIGDPTGADGPQEVASLVERAIETVEAESADDDAVAEAVDSDDEVTVDDAVGGGAEEPDDGADPFEDLPGIPDPQIEIPDDENAEFLDDDGPEIPDRLDDLSTLELARTDPVESTIATSIRDSQCNRRQGWAVVEAIAEEGPIHADDIEAGVDARVQHVWTLLSELRALEFVGRSPEGQYSLDRGTMAEIVAEADRVSEQFQEFKEHAKTVE